MRKFIIGGGLTAALIVASATTASAQDLEPETPGFVRIWWIGFVLFALVAIGTSIFRFVRVREMGINRGLNERDATTNALFGEGAGAAALTLRDSEADTPDVEDRLEKIEELRTKGLISDEEAAERRSEILDEI